MKRHQQLEVTKRARGSQCQRASGPTFEMILLVATGLSDLKIGAALCGVKRQTVDLRLHNTTFIGFVPLEKMPEMYDSEEILLSPFTLIGATTRKLQ